MNRIPLAVIDLRALAAVDPVAAEIGRQLNSARGVNLDGDPNLLRRDEFMAAGSVEYALNPALRQVLARLDQAFFASRPSPIPTVEPALIRAGALTPIARGGIAMPGTVLVSPDGRQTAFVGRGDTGEVLRGAAAGNGPFSAPIREPLVAAGVTGARIGGRDWLYTVEPDGASLTRREVLPSGLGPPERVEVSPPLPAMHWPQMTALDDGRVALGAVIPSQAPFIALSSDGGKRFQVTANLAHGAAGCRRTCAPAAMG